MNWMKKIWVWNIIDKWLIGTLYLFVQEIFFHSNLIIFYSGSIYYSIFWFDIITFLALRCFYVITLSLCVCLNWIVSVELQEKKRFCLFVFLQKKYWKIVRLCLLARSLCLHTFTHYPILFFLCLFVCELKKKISSCLFQCVNVDLKKDKIYNFNESMQL